MPSHKKTGVPGKCSLPPGYVHPHHIAWAKPYMNAYHPEQMMVVPAGMDPGSMASGAYHHPPGMASMNVPVPGQGGGEAGANDDEDGDAEKSSSEESSCDSASESL